MKKASHTSVAVDRKAEIAPDSVRQCLEAILATDSFANSERLSRFLRFVVECALVGKGDQIKEYVVGVEAFDRPESYDPRTDPVVRVEARRLRAKLKEYYATVGAQDPVWIDIPKGSYAPVIQPRQPAIAPSPDREEKISFNSFPRGRNLVPAVLAVCSVLLLCAAAYWIFVLKSKGEPSVSIAVLPFMHMGSPEDEYFTDGLVDELTTVLAQLKGLRVVSRTSAFQFRGANQDIRMVGRKLGVDNIIEGSVQRTGNKLRINIQLINAIDGFHLWSRSFDRNATDIFSVQDEVTRAVAKVLAVQVSKDKTVLAKRMSRDPEAYNLYLKGQYFKYKMKSPDVQKAIGYLEQSVKTDPAFAPAYAALADCYATIIYRETESKPALVIQAKAAAEKALQLDSNLAEAHAVLAWIQYFYDWNWQGSERGMLLALELDPASARTHDMYSQVLMSAGQFNKAIIESKKAIALDPLNSKISATLGVIYYCSRQYDNAIRQARLVLEMDPHFFLAQTVMGVSYEEKRMFQPARDALRLSLREYPDDSDTMAHLAVVESRLRNDAEAVRLRDTLEKSSPKPWFDLAAIYAASGDRDRAFEALEYSRQQHSTNFPILNVDPAFISLHSDPRFARIQKMMGWTN